MLYRFEESRSLLPWTFKLIILCTIVLVLEFIVPERVWVPYFALIPALLPVRPWTLVTSIFLHGGFEHYFFNMLALFFFGIYLERLLGSRRFLEVFFVGGIIGNIGYLLTAYAGLPSANPLVPALGASGAIYAIMAALAVLRPRLLVYVYGFVPIPISLAMIIWALLDVAGLFAPTGIAHGAHLAGLLAGLYYGFKVRSEWKRLERAYLYWR